MSRWLHALLVASVMACGGSGAIDDGPIASGAPDASLEEEPCERESRAAGDPRRVVVGHPYDSEGQEATVYQVLELDAGGALSETGPLFEMGRPTSARIAFTPDGAIGIAPQEDGTLGVFRFEGDGVVVVHDRFEGPFYAGNVLVADGGREALIADVNWRENGGGLYRVSIACDGTLANEGLVVAGKGARGLQRIPGSDRALLAADDIGDSPAEMDVHVLSLASMELPERISSGDAFDDDEAIVSAVAVTTDARYALIGDTNGFSDVAGNRVGVSSLGDQPAPVQVVEIEDPYEILVSPFGNAVAIVSGFGDAIFGLGYDPDAAVPLSEPVELSYLGPAPALPGVGAVIDDGPLRGMTLVAENVSIRVIRFHDDGSIADEGAVPLLGGSGLTAITSALGIAP